MSKEEKEKLIIKIQNYIKNKAGFDVIGGDGCDKDEIFYGANDNHIIELVVKYLSDNDLL